ncbi:CsbD family protein [Flocculibacter collagenilyticus]|uniref:CsbD family protein n=1 Tax=Flocculibacter collagenilyticus TaxID=2744479 RepID=UPI0018F491A5|nr:CsbD family protein [Flocculibacter collagenilyticus]
MNKDIAEGKWKQMKGSVKQKWGKLTDDDVQQINGRCDKFCGKMQERYGMQREEAEREFNQLNK